MKYDDVVLLVNGGLSSMTSHNLSVNSAYAVTKFKREILSLFEDWKAKNNELLNEVGIDDGNVFDARRKELADKIVNKKKLDTAEAKEFDDMTQKLERLQGLRVQLANDDVTINIKPMSFGDWHAFKNENKEYKFEGVEVLELAEGVLENILWTAPE